MTSVVDEDKMAKDMLAMMLRHSGDQAVRQISASGQDASEQLEVQIDRTDRPKSGYSMLTSWGQ